ncbi:MAG: molecular chaperone HtpG [Bacteroidetes bacterium]|nr:MAG: molecular chaperone HtpG [Bacteroidota bacterium]
MQKGKINVTGEDIFPIIKKFLYSDHEIFLRELVSNAVDATQKLKILASKGEFKNELGNLTIRIKTDKKAKTLTISDAGIGMNAKEIDKYINQIAFSGAEDFMKKYKDDANAIIGHFGLGFYSSFMVADRVEIVSKSYKDDKSAVKWECDGSPNFNLEETEKEKRGTDIILHMDKDSENFLEDSKIEELLNKYCKFLPVKIAFGKEKEYKDDKQVETDKDHIINNTQPAWTKKPADLKDEDYNSFYKELYPASFEEPLFHIHLNVDFPFNLTGILYFPKFKNTIEIQKNKIQLYQRQVFVTDSVEGIVPEFLTLLHGVLDSPDIPLNVSRSYLQSDKNVKKISNHITKKVADRLKEIFTNERENFEKKWNDLRIFIEYGMLSDEKFYEKAVNFFLLQNTEGKFFTFDEYKKLTEPNQTDKDKNLIYLYTTDPEEQYSFIEEAKEKGYDVLVMNGQLDAHFINQVETKLSGIRFTRVDADIIDKLIQKDENFESKLTKEDEENLSMVFQSQLPNDSTFLVSFEAMRETANPTLVTQNEFMRRMKDMSKFGGEASYYGLLPDSFNLIVNSNHKLVLNLNEKLLKTKAKDLKLLNENKVEINTEIDALNTLQKDKKEEEIPKEEKDKREELNKKLQEVEDKKRDVLTKFGNKQKLVKQLIDLGLLANNMLKGESLSNFVKRSVELIER